MLFFVTSMCFRCVNSKNGLRKSLSVDVVVLARDKERNWIEKES